MSLRLILCFRFDSVNVLTGVSNDLRTVSEKADKRPDWKGDKEGLHSVTL